MAKKEAGKTIEAYAKEHNAGIVMLFGRKLSFTIFPIGKQHEGLATRMNTLLSTRLSLEVETKVNPVNPNDPAWRFFKQIPVNEQKEPDNFQDQGQRTNWTAKKPLSRNPLLALLNSMH